MAWVFIQIFRWHSVRILSSVIFLIISAGYERAYCLPSESDGTDTRLFRSVNNAQTSFKTSFFLATDNSVIVFTVGVPLGCLVYGLASHDNDVFISGVLVSATEVFAYSAKYLVKGAVQRARPYEELSGVFVNNVESADAHSFPSGHTTGAFALATMLTLRYPKPSVYVPAFVWAGLVGYGRVYNGVHYPSDVVAGAVLGAGSSLLTYALRGTILEVFTIVTGLNPEPGSVFLISPLPAGMVAHVRIAF